MTTAPGTASAFAVDGSLSRLLEGYSPRSGQFEMARAVERAIEDRSSLVCEAGTGTGKTLAYLIPAIADGGQVVISTGTRHLQEQLFNRDLPLACKALGRAPRTALLKGRSNYLCRWRYELALTSGRLTSSAVAGRIAELADWAERTVSGDRSEASEFSEDDVLWRHVTSTADNCLGSKCPSYDRCHVVDARRRAVEADVVVVNHHLLFADMSLKEQGVGEILPLGDTLIIDEAHQIPDIATRFFGIEVTSGQFAELARDVSAAARVDAPDTPDLDAMVREFEHALDRAVRAFGDTPYRAEWSTTPAAARDGLVDFAARLHALSDALATIAVRGPTIESAADRARDLTERLRAIDAEPAPEDCARWFEVRTRGFAGHLAPLDPGPILASRIAAEPRAWIVTSATLSVSGSLEHFASRVGLGDARLRIFDGGFDYRAQTRCYLPDDMPEPSDPSYHRAVAGVARDVLAVSRGRAFLLFTSHRAMHAVRAELDGTVPYPLFTQGERPRGELLRRFIETADAVLLGTQSFWEGVDIRGDALSLVLIDKLPFAPPDEPLLAARASAARRAGVDPFSSIQLPAAVIGLKQGVGRLIRHRDDTGVVVLCDPRLRSKRYGKIFLDSLPPMPRVTALSDVVEFFDDCEAGAPPTAPRGTDGLELG